MVESRVTSIIPEVYLTGGTRAASRERYIVRDPLRSKDAHTDSKFEGFYSLFAAAAQTNFVRSSSSFVNTKSGGQK